MYSIIKKFKEWIRRETFLRTDVMKRSDHPEYLHEIVNNYVNAFVRWSEFEYMYKYKMENNQKYNNGNISTIDLMKRKYNS